jgi:hypothetical protein
MGGECETQSYEFRLGEDSKLERMVFMGKIRNVEGLKSLIAAINYPTQ